MTGVQTCALPISIASAIVRENLDVCGDYAIGHYTHEKNPVTARAALTTLEIIQEEGLVDRAAELGSYAIDRMSQLITTSPIVGDVRGRGLLFGVEIVSDKINRTPANDLAEKIYYKCMDAGLSFKISQGSVLTLSPPLTISRSDLETALTIVEEAIMSVSSQ